MQTSKATLPEQLPKTNKIPRVDIIGAIIFIIIGTIGFLDATYLTIEDLRGTIPLCAIVSGCKQVLQSGYAHLGPIPLSVLGMIYYAVVIIGALLFFDLKKIRFLHLLADFTLLGIFASGYFIFLQIFIIKALCIYCLGSALTSTLLFLNGWYVYRKTRPTNLDSSHSDQTS